jgi:outer membrane protein assembly factor BamB
MKQMVTCLGGVFCTVSFLLLAAPAHAGDWTQFRGPNGTATSLETGLPIRWSRTENIRWKVELPGRGLSCPVIASGRVYVTACTGYQQRRLHVLCFDATNGARLWERQLWATGSTMCNSKTCMAAPTPVTDGERVYALFATGDLACLEKDGDLLWYRSLVGDYPTITNQVGMAASPILWKDTLFLPMENAGESFVAGVNKFTGQNRWKVERSRGIYWVTPQLFRNGDRTEVLFQSGGETTAFDPESGHKLWAYKGGPSGVVSPLASDGLALVPGGEFTALRPAKDAATPEVVWKTNKLKTSYSSALAYQGRVYAVNGANVLNCAEAGSGKILWQQRLKGPFWASPVAADGKIYLVNEEGTTTVIQTGDQPQIVSTNPLGETMLATPAIANGAIFLRSDQHLYCIGAKTGN